ncbi:hypothetical protein KSC_104360 [Ktedonobacter sp. SOSP1-52]|nr:hypothetical protein KSC_104360 [Ktedonobacter sp. SOSP1-52]
MQKERNPKVLRANAGEMVPYALAHGEPEKAREVIGNPEQFDQDLPRGVSPCVAC